MCEASLTPADKLYREKIKNTSCDNSIVFLGSDKENNEGQKIPGDILSQMMECYCNSTGKLPYCLAGFLYSKGQSYSTEAQNNFITECQKGDQTIIFFHPRIVKCNREKKPSPTYLEFQAMLNLKDRCIFSYNYESHTVESIDRDRLEEIRKNCEDISSRFILPPIYLAKKEIGPIKGIWDALAETYGKIVKKEDDIEFHPLN